MPAVSGTYPAQVEGRLDPGLSRWLWMVKWLLVIPHVLVLAALWMAFAVLSVIAFFAIAFTGTYPRGIFDFNVGVLRWTWRVAFYTCAANGTDRYPPFTLAETDYPANLTVDYPAHLSRGLVLVKWWLLAIPHYLVVGLLMGGAVWFSKHYVGGLVPLLTFFAVVWLLFTGVYPRSIFDLVLGLNRWVLRVAAYAGLMTDQYPPFRLDVGPTEPQAALPGITPAPARPHDVRILPVVLGSLLALAGAGVLAAGGAGLIVDRTQRDAAGYVMSSTESVSTRTYALVSERVDAKVDGADWAAGDLLGTIQIRSESGARVFVGIGRASAVDEYLAQSRHAEVRDLASHHETHIVSGGSSAPQQPLHQTFWAASTQGRGDQTLQWKPRSGAWKAVVMNADGSAGVSADVSIGAELPHLLTVALVVVGFGLVLVAGGVALVYVGARGNTK